MMERELAYMVGKAVGAACEERIILENNGNAKHVLVIREPGAEVCPTIYIDGILESIRNGETGMGEAVTAVTDIYREARSPEWLQGIGKRLMEKEYVLENVIYQVVGLKKNLCRLSKMPHKLLLDLAAVYRVVLENCGMHEHAGFVVENEFRERCGITEEELDAAARRNTDKRGFCIRSIGLFLRHVTGAPVIPPGCGDNIWVITTTDGYYGAAALLYGKSCLGKLADRIGSDLYVLPASIHEVIAVPVGKAHPGELIDMVYTINAEEVEPEEVLSNSVYRYNRRDGSLMPAGKDIN